MDKRLGETAVLAGDDYSIADVATWPWVSRFEWHALDDGLNGFLNVKRWYQEISARPGVQRGYDVPARGQEIPKA
jgi:GST-like protein